MTKRIVLILVLFAAVGAAVWAAVRFVRPRWQGQASYDSADAAATATADTWYQAVEKVKADRGESAGVNVRGDATGAQTLHRAPLVSRHAGRGDREIRRSHLPGLHGPRRNDRTR